MKNHPSKLDLLNGNFSDKAPAVKRGRKSKAQLKARQRVKCLNGCGRDVRKKDIMCRYCRRSSWVKAQRVEFKTRRRNKKNKGDE